MQTLVFGPFLAPGAAGRGSVAHEGDAMGICAETGEDFQPGALSWRKRQLCWLERASLVREGRLLQWLAAIVAIFLAPEAHDKGF